jgi:hypothetical protein
MLYCIDVLRCPKALEVDCSWCPRDKLRGIEKWVN